MPLSLGWRDSELFKQLDFDHNPRDVSASELYTKYAVTAAAEIPPIIEADLAWARHNKYQVTMMTKPLIARLRFDPEVAAESFAHLKTSANPNVKASLPRLLAATGEITAERANWCREELGRQRSLRSPEIGYDVLRECPEVSACAYLNRSERHHLRGFRCRPRARRLVLTPLTLEFSFLLNSAPVAWAKNTWFRHF